MYFYVFWILTGQHCSLSPLVCSVEGLHLYSHPTYFELRTVDLFVFNRRTTRHVQNGGGGSWSGARVCAEPGLPVTSFFIPIFCKPEIRTAAASSSAQPWTRVHSCGIKAKQEDVQSAKRHSQTMGGALAAVELRPLNKRRSRICVGTASRLTRRACHRTCDSGKLY